MRVIPGGARTDLALHHRGAQPGAAGTFEGLPDEFADALGRRVRHRRADVVAGEIGQSLDLRGVAGGDDDRQIVAGLTSSPPWTAGIPVCAA
jgi:hypothetical protein